MPLVHAGLPNHAGHHRKMRRRMRIHPDNQVLRRIDKLIVQGLPSSRLNFRHGRLSRSRRHFCRLLPVILSAYGLYIIQTLLFAQISPYLDKAVKI